jgi:hypothetical protein
MVPCFRRNSERLLVIQLKSLLRKHLHGFYDIKRDTKSVKRLFKGSYSEIVLHEKKGGYIFFNLRS